MLNAEEVLLISVETMEEIKVYDSTVLNPYNLSVISMLEHAF